VPARIVRPRLSQRRPQGRHRRPNRRATPEPRPSRRCAALTEGRTRGLPARRCSPGRANNGQRTRLAISVGSAYAVPSRCEGRSSCWRRPSSVL